MGLGTGSRRVFTYVDDLGTSWNVELDESNAESTDLGFTVGVAGQLAKEVSSAYPFRMRSVRAQRINSDGDKVAREFYMGTAAALAAAVTAGTIEVSGKTYDITLPKGEVRKLLAIGDTGITDGDAPG